MTFQSPEHEGSYVCFARQIVQGHSLEDSQFEYLTPNLTRLNLRNEWTARLGVCLHTLANGRKELRQLLLEISNVTVANRGDSGHEQAVEHAGHGSADLVNDNPRYGCFSSNLRLDADAKRGIVHVKENYVRLARMTVIFEIDFVSRVIATR